MSETGQTLAIESEERPVRRGPGRPSRSNAELLDLSLDLFYEHGFERTSIDAICAAAGMAKRTVYARYGDKQTLFKAALTRAIEKWIVPIDRLRAQESDDLEQTLLKIGRILVANVLSSSGLRLLRLTNAESVRMPEISTFSVQRGTEPTLDYLADLFRRRCARDSIASAEEIASAFLNLVVGGVSNNAAWGMVLQPETIDRHTTYCVRLFLYGLLPHGDGPVDEENRRLKTLLAETAELLTKASR
jgi:AcrR family transcriptional regulator